MPPRWMKRCITSATWFQTNTRRYAGCLYYTPWIWREPRRLDHDQRPAYRAAAQPLMPHHRARGGAERPASTLYGILDPGGLINVVTKRPEKTFGGSISATSSSFGGGTGQVDVTGPIDGPVWRTA